MVKKYTLIDGFDKIDLSTTPTNDVRLEGLGEKSIRTNIINETAFVNTGMKHAFHRKFWSTQRYSYKFLPDLFRFLTGRRFAATTAGSGKWHLMAPPAAVNNVETYRKLLIGRTPGPDFCTDLTKLAETINSNFEALGMNFSFENYFALSPKTSTFQTKSGETVLGVDHFDMTAYNSRVEVVKNLMAEFKKMNKISVNRLTAGAFEAWKVDTFDTFDVLPFDSLKLLSVDLGAHSEEMQGWLHAALFGAAPGQEKDPTKMELVWAVLQLMFFTYSVSKADFGQRRPYHPYFVTTLDAAQPKGLLNEHVMTGYVNVAPYYNCYREDHEEMPENVSSEWQLPSPYIYNGYKSFSGNYFRDLFTLGQEVDLEKSKVTVSQYFDIIKNSESVSPSEIQANLGTLLAPYGSTSPVPMNNPEFSTPERFRTIILNDENLMASTKTLKKVFPYGVEIDLGYSQPSQFLNVLKEQGETYFNMFTTMLANQSNNIAIANSNAHRFVMHREFEADLPLENQGAASSTAAFNSQFSLLDLQFFDVSQMLNINTVDEFYQHFGQYIDDKRNVNLSEAINASPSMGKALYYLGIQNLKTPLNKYLSDRALTMPEIYAGEGCHTEVIAYEIAKYKKSGKLRGDLGDRTPVQSIFIPNAFPQDSPLSYLDTQVFYGHDYVYEIFAHTLVVGATYKYGHSEAPHAYGMPPNSMISSPESKSDTVLNKYIEFDLPHPLDTHLIPYGIIVRAPYHNTLSLATPYEGQEITKVVDKPPLPPEVSFHPYEGSSNKVLILLNKNYGERLMVPNDKIFVEDILKVADYKIAQAPLNNPPGHILYRTENDLGTYEIYRSHRKPEKWSDFRDEATVKKIALDSTRQSGFNDSVIPNVDYYYFARFVDIHGNISNPTSIFKLRIVKEESFPPYMVLKPYSFPRRDLVTSIPFKKYLKISLSDALRSIVGDNADTAQVLYMRRDGGPVKKYKFRVTSKKTGKKIDINVDMANKIINKFNAQSPGEHPGEASSQTCADEAPNNPNFGNSSDELCLD
jgi:hypothetical protein